MLLNFNNATQQAMKITSSGEIAGSEDLLETPRTRQMR